MNKFYPSEGLFNVRSPARALPEQQLRVVCENDSSRNNCIPDHLRFRQLFEEAIGILVSLLRIRRQVAEEALEEAILSFLKWQKSNGPIEDNPGGWLFITARNAALKMVKHARRFANHDHWDQEQERKVPEENPLLVDLGIALESLPDMQQQVALYVYGEDRSYKEAMEEFELSHSAIHGLLIRARKNIRKQIDKKTA